MNRRERRAAKNGPKLEGAEIRYGGRTLELRVYVNTDEAPEVVYERVRHAVKSAPNCPMTVITCGEVPVDQAEGLWEATIRALEQQAEREGRTN